MPHSPGCAAAPLTRNEFQHRLRFEASTGGALQAQMHKRRDGYSQSERWTTSKTAQAESDATLSDSTSTTTTSHASNAPSWALAKAISATVPVVNDHRTLQQ